MSQPITLFTGQWADLSLSEVAGLASSWGYDGLEIACSAEHLDVWRAAEEPKYLAERQEILKRNGLQTWAISNHLTGQAVCDNPIDFRHRGIVRPAVWGDGEQEGVRQRAAEEMKLTAIAARKLGVDTVVGFTGSSIWQYVAMFPPVSQSVIDQGYEDFAKRWNPIMDVFDSEGVRFALEVHPSEIAYDYHTTRIALDAIDNRKAFGLNWDPSHMIWQDIDPVNFILDFAVHTLAGQIREEAGLSFQPAAVMSIGSRALERLEQLDTTAQSQLSGKTRAWIDFTAPPRQLVSSRV